MLTSPQVEANDEFSFTTSVSYSSGSTTIDGGIEIAIGSTIITAAGIPASTTVTAKNIPASTITISAATTASSGGPITATFNLKTIQPVLAMAADQGEGARMLKSAHEATLVYRHYASNPVGVMKLTHNARMGTAAVTLVTLPTTGTQDVGRAVIPMPQLARSPGEVVEFGVTHSYGYAPSTPPEIWGISEAEVEELDAAPAY
mgnify:FL=1